MSSHAPRSSGRYFIVVSSSGVGFRFQPPAMANVLSDEKKQQVIALGRLRWSLRRIEEETGVRRETASAYLRAAGVAVRPPRGWGRRPPAEPASASPPSNPANEVSTGSGSGDSPGPNPANDPS